jgi:hypothetical protein
MKVFLSLVVFVAMVFVSAPSVAEVVQPIGAAPQVLIPAAGNVNGQNGTFFRSDITIVNLRNSDQIVFLEWLPQPGATPTSTSIMIHALSGIRSSDFVHDYLNTTGLGAIVVTAVTQPIAEAIDVNGRLFVSSRIWTPQPSTTGTTSQNLSTIPLSTINTPAAAIFGAGGADSPSDYRVNVGIVNVDASRTQTFVVAFSSTQATTVVLPPRTMQQVSSIGAFTGQQILISNVSTNGSNLWTAYASTINNVTGDAWSELAVAGTQ